MVLSDRAQELTLSRTQRESWSAHTGKLAEIATTSVLLPMRSETDEGKSGSR